MAFGEEGKVPAAGRQAAGEATTMRRMSGYDAQFVYDERPEEPQHTLKLALLGPGASAAYHRDGIAGTRRWLAAHLPQLPPLRWRAQRVPLDLYHPLWVEDAPVDLERHVRRVALPAPGGHAELCEVLSDLLGQPLDPGRPLWELWVLEGLESDRVAYAFKMSHALADGNASRELLERLFSEPAEEASEAEPLERHPQAAALALAALRDATRDQLRYGPHLLGAVLRARLKGHAERPEEEPEERPKRPPVTRLHSPWTPFSGPIHRGRSFDFAVTSLAQAREIRRTFGCTLNDVIVATAAGGVRAYLLEHGALPGLPTRGPVAVSVRTADDPVLWGNYVVARSLPLPTQLADPVARLRACARADARVKDEVARIGGVALEAWQRRLPPAFDKALAGAARALVRVRRDFTGGVMVSNVRGPQHPLQAPGGPVERLVSVGHMKYAAGLNTTVWSYGDELCFGFYACTDAVRDLPRLARHVSAAFEELHKAATLEAARTATAETPPAPPTEAPCSTA